MAARRGSANKTGKCKCLLYNMSSPSGHGWVTSFRWSASSRHSCLSIGESKVIGGKAMKRSPSWNVECSCSMTSSGLLLTGNGFRLSGIRDWKKSVMFFFSAYSISGSWADTPDSKQNVWINSNILSAGFYGAVDWVSRKRVSIAHVWDTM